MEWVRAVGVGVVGDAMACGSQIREVTRRQRRASSGRPSLDSVQIPCSDPEGEWTGVERLPNKSSNAGAGVCVRVRARGACMRMHANTCARGPRTRECLRTTSFGRVRRRDRVDARAWARERASVGKGGGGYARACADVSSADCQPRQRVRACCPLNRSSITRSRTRKQLAIV
eukprot:4019758-Pleurochrysis_carterae.AAC.2